MVKDSVALRFLPGVLATAVVGLVAATRPLSSVPRAIALFFVVGAWAAPVVFRKKVREHASVVAAIGAATAAGEVNAGIPYGIACVLLLLGCLVSLRAARAAPMEKPRSARRPRLMLVATAVGVSGVLVFGLPKLAERIQRRLEAMFGGDGEQATAFSTTMVLGSTRGMLQSDAIVLRIDGRRPEYLRGAVYDRYDPPYWVTTAPGRERHTVPASTAPDPNATRITLVRGAPVGEDMRWFLPPQPCDFGVSAGQLEVDAFGVARRGRGDDPMTLSLRVGCRDAPPIAPPTASDLDVPVVVRRSLAPIAAGWTAGASSDREKLVAIQRELSRFEYSLEVPRQVGIDPIVDFVSVHRAGHCEMFASAMALMARTQGIPTRVVGGYRVSEVNPLTGRAVVRDRNAHAWVEAWVDGAWHGMDPTPVSESFAPSAGTFDHLGDLVSATLERIAIGLTRLGLRGTATMLGGLVTLLLAVRWLTARVRERRNRRRGDTRSPPPLPCFEALSAALASAGHQRDASEPVEVFARRVGAIEAPWALHAAEALRAYANLRYGGVGNEPDVVRIMDRSARAIRKAVAS